VFKEASVPALPSALPSGPPSAPDVRGAPRVVLEDPYVKSMMSETAAGVELRFPVFEPAPIRSLVRLLRLRADDVFSRLALPEIEAAMDRLDSHFADLSNPEVRAVVDLVQRVDGFSRHDIERFGLGIFSPLATYDRGLRGRFVEAAFRTRRPVETVFGHLKRFGANTPFAKWREPGLLTHFVSGNVVGYSAILARIGLPLRRGGGAAQIIKLPSTSAVFPMIYLAKMAELAPLLRETMACGYWKGGDPGVEDPVLDESDAVNVLGSEATIREVGRRARDRRRRPSPPPNILAHGHKVGAAYVGRKFAEVPELRARAIEGLVRDISAFDGAACYCPKNIYVQGDHRAFAEELAEGLGRFARDVSPVNEAVRPVGRGLERVFTGSAKVLPCEGGSAFVRVSDRTEFWLPDETYRYVQVMPAGNIGSTAAVMRRARPFLQTVVAAVRDGEVVEALVSFGGAGASNIHYPGSAPLLNVYEEPHDGDFDVVKVRYPYQARFAATNFKRNADWL
jgi:hypothetical protein